MAFFLRFASADATISQFKSQSHTLISDLIAFIRGLNEEEDVNEDIMLKIRLACLKKEHTS